MPTSAARPRPAAAEGPLAFDAGPVLFDPLRAAVGRRAGIAFLHDLTVLPTALGRDAGLYGAAALALTRAGLLHPQAARS